MVDSVLEGRLGTGVADDPRSPRVARLELGCYAIFGGDPSLPAARELARQVAAPRELLFPDSDAWRRLLHDDPLQRARSREGSDEVRGAERHVRHDCNSMHHATHSLYAPSPADEAPRSLA